VDWVWDFDFLDDWNLDLLVDGIFLDMMVVDGMDVVWDRDLDVMAVDQKKSENN
jgi:hypothetical protein